MLIIAGTAPTMQDRVVKTYEREDEDADIVVTLAATGGAGGGAGAGGGGTTVVKSTLLNGVGDYGDDDDDDAAFLAQYRAKKIATLKAAAGMYAESRAHACQCGTSTPRR